VVPSGRLAILLAAILWSSGGLFIKAAPLDGLQVVAGRAIVTVLFQLAVLRPDLRRARWASAVPYACMLVTYVTATKLTTAANAIVLQYSGTAWLLLLAPRVLGEPVRRADLGVVALCLVGMGLCALDSPSGATLAETAWLGNLLATASGGFYAIAILGMRRDTLEGRETASTTLGNALAAGFAVALAPVLGTGPWSRALEPVALGALLWLGVVQIGVAYLLFQRGLRTTPAATAALLVLVEPVLSPAWVWLGTGEAPGAWTLAGGAVVLGAIAAREVRGLRPPGVQRDGDRAPSEGSGAAPGASGVQ
jgi:drug/metabolite transporter (DMT)-like permease